MGVFGFGDRGGEGEEACEEDREEGEAEEGDGEGAGEVYFEI